MTRTGVERIANEAVKDAIGLYGRYFKVEDAYGPFSPEKYMECTEEQCRAEMDSNLMSVWIDIRDTMTLRTAARI